MQKEDVKLLLVEDDQNARMSVRIMLKEIGIGYIVEAANGKAALDVMEEQQDTINFIVCDWNMPDKNGFELLREIRQTHPDIPFLMVTARADQNSVVDAKSAGVTGYVRKPFSLGELEEKINAILARSR